MLNAIFKLYGLRTKNVRFSTDQRTVCRSTDVGRQSGTGANPTDGREKSDGIRYDRVDGSGAARTESAVEKSTSATESRPLHTQGILRS